MISLGSTHVRCTPVWALSTCGEPNEIEPTPIGVTLNGSGRVREADGDARGLHRPDVEHRDRLAFAERRPPRRDARRDTRGVVRVAREARLGPAGAVALVGHLRTAAAPAAPELSTMATMARQQELRGTIATIAASRLADSPLLYITLNHRVKKGVRFLYATDGVDVALWANRLPSPCSVGVLRCEARVTRQ